MAQTSNEVLARIRSGKAEREASSPDPVESGTSPALRESRGYSLANLGRNSVTQLRALPGTLRASSQEFSRERPHSSELAGRQWKSRRILASSIKQESEGGYTSHERQSNALVKTLLQKHMQANERVVKTSRQRTRSTLLNQAALAPAEVSRAFQLKRSMDQGGGLVASQVLAKSAAGGVVRAASKDSTNRSCHAPNSKSFDNPYSPSHTQGMAPVQSGKPPAYQSITSRFSKSISILHGDTSSACNSMEERRADVKSIYQTESQSSIRKSAAPRAGRSARQLVQLRPEVENASQRPKDHRTLHQTALLKKGLMDQKRRLDKLIFQI